MVEKLLQKWSPTLATRDMQIKTILGFFLPRSKRPRSIRRMTEHAGKDVGEEEHLHISLGSPNRFSH